MPSAGIGGKSGERVDARLPDIGLPETKPNRKAANIKAQTIELDMTSGNFDRSLAKYKPQAQSEAISVVEMFERFTHQKQRTISIGGLAKYLS